ASHVPAETQQAKLLEIVGRNAESEYGRQHNFSSIKSIADFQAAVPVNKYEDLQPYISRVADGAQSVLTKEQPFMFATTSGTTGARKMIPVTRSYLKEFRKASVVSGFFQIKNHPALAEGVIFSVFSSAEEGRTKAGIPYGAISGRLYLEEPKLIKKYISPIPYEAFLIDDYESRYYTLLRCGLVLPVSVFYTLNPSTIMILVRRLKTYGPQLIKDIADGTITAPQPLPDHIREAVKPLLARDGARAAELQRLFDTGRFTPPNIWKQLAVISCWTKASASFYLSDLHDSFGSLPVTDITYGASEGRGTVALSENEQMLAIRSHFFEFIPENDPQHRPLTATELEQGESYSILFTTSAGLYRYDINDIVKVTAWHNRTPVLEFMHKKGNVSSFTGEKVTESQVTESVSRAAARLNLKIRFFTVVPEFRPEPHYQLWFELIELIDDAASADQLGRLFDEELCAANSEYETKRQSRRLTEVVSQSLPAGSYESLRKTLVASGVPDAQVKVSHLNPKDEIKQLLREQTLIATRERS
ncbi:MAG TPA: GH3 auxin-responsive promoter family protein, partial [Chroococcales cyanobacterium]